MTTTESGTDEAAQKTTVTVTVDGETFEAQPGELIIKAAQEHGIYIPRFCWHERMKPVGMCRMCLVEVDGVRGFPPACTTPVADGMVVHTQNDTVKKIQDGVLEFLLINHPLDCPVCDRGGECPLQDQTLAFGPGESRFVEEKRHFPKPIPLSELVLLDRERCIQCARCTRFADEIAGDPLIDFVDRGDRMQVLNFEEQPFDSYFSGNTVQICPVGALTASQYRFRARPWDLATVETSCTTCSVQCRGAVQSSSNRLGAPARRRLRAGQPRLAVRQGPLRHRVGALRRPHPRTAGARRRGDAWQQVSWPEALDHAAGAIAKAQGTARRGIDRGHRRRARHQRRRVRVGAARQGRDRHRQRRRAARRRVAGRVRARACRAPRSPISTARARSCCSTTTSRTRFRSRTCALRRAVIELGVPLVDLRAGRARAVARTRRVVARTVPGETLDAGRARPDRAAAGRIATGPVVVIAGRGNVADARRRDGRGAASNSPALDDVRFLSGAAARQRARRARRRPHTRLPARAGSRSTTAANGSPNAWGARAGDRRSRHRRHPARRGRRQDPRARAARRRPDRRLPRRHARASTRSTAPARSSRSTRSSRSRRKRADVFLPCTLWGEKAGTVTNLEGRVQRVGRKVAPEGTAMDDWRIADRARVASRRATSTSRPSTRSPTRSRAVAPAFAGVTAELLDTRRATASSCRCASTSTRSCLRTRRPVDPGRRRPGHVVGSDQGRRRRSRARRRVRSGRGRTRHRRRRCPALHTWSPAGAEPRSSRRATRTLCASWWVARSTTTVGSSSETPMLQRVARDRRTCASTRATLARIGVDGGEPGQGHVGARLAGRHRRARRIGVPRALRASTSPPTALGPALLIDASAPVTDLRVETLR